MGSQFLVLKETKMSHEDMYLTPYLEDGISIDDAISSEAKNSAETLCKDTIAVKETMNEIRDIICVQAVKVENSSLFLGEAVVLAEDTVQAVRDAQNESDRRSSKIYSLIMLGLLGGSIAAVSLVTSLVG